MNLEQIYTLGWLIGIGTVTVVVAICLGLWLAFRDTQDNNGWVPLFVAWVTGFVCSVFWPIALTVAVIVGIVYAIVAPIRWLAGRHATR